MTSPEPPSSRVRLAIAQYDRPGHPSPPGHEHWALVVAIPGAPSQAGGWQVFQIVGNTDTYCYQTKAFCETERALLCGGCAVGELLQGAEGVEWLKDHLESAVEIVRGDPAWNCQRWVVEVVRELRQHPDRVAVLPSFNERKARAVLFKEREDWECGEDHYFGRLEREWK